MARPINELAQRIAKVNEDITFKLKVLSLLSSEFFEEIRLKKDESQLVDHFGGPLGRLLWRHALLEERYNTLASEQVNSVAAGEDEDDHMAEEDRLVKEDLKMSTLKLIRNFSKPENQEKLTTLKISVDGEIQSFMETWALMIDLTNYNLTTPQEEVQSNEEQKIKLNVEVSKLKELSVSAAGDYTRQSSECQKHMEANNERQKQLKDEIGEQRQKRDTRIQQAVDAGLEEQRQIEQEHKSEMDRLERECKKIRNALNALKKESTSEEENLRNLWSRKEQNLRLNVAQYDTEIQASEETNKKMNLDYEDTATDLAQAREEYDLLREEARKREEIAAILARKNAEFSERMNKLNKASEYIQAHWLGMIARKERDKAMKGKKKKKKKK